MNGKKIWGEWFNLLQKWRDEISLIDELIIHPWTYCTKTFIWGYICKITWRFICCLVMSLYSLLRFEDKGNVGPFSLFSLTFQPGENYIPKQIVREASPKKYLQSAHAQSCSNPKGQYPLNDAYNWGKTGIYSDHNFRTDQLPILWRNYSHRHHMARGNTTFQMLLLFLWHI